MPCQRRGKAVADPRAGDDPRFRGKGGDPKSRPSRPSGQGRRGEAAGVSGAEQAVLHPVHRPSTHRDICGNQLAAMKPSLGKTTSEDLSTHRSEATGARMQP